MRYNRKNDNSHMFQLQKWQQRYQDFMYEHGRLRQTFNYIFTFIIAVVAAFIFAYSFRGFITTTNPNVDHLITGGVSGLSQIFTILAEFTRLFPQVESKTFQAIFYLMLNLPLFVLGFKGIGKRFTLFSIVNVVFTSLFIQILPNNWLTIFDITTDMLGRALFAGFLSGVGTTLCFRAEISGGGLDIVTYYIANHKSTSVGKYQITINAIILVFYTMLTIIRDGSGLGALNSFLYTLVYLFTNGRVVDAFNIRNKKAQMQIITNIEGMPKIILANFPHSCTVVNAKGGFSGEPRLIIYIVVSSFEVKRVVKLVRSIDAKSFIDVSYGHQVYGRFFIKPVK